MRRRCAGAAAMAAAVAVAAAAQGCFSIEKAHMKCTGQEHVLASNYGWYLFNFLPLASGNASFDAISPSVFLRDDVTMDKIQDRFMKYADGENCDVANLQYTTRESVMLEIPGMGTTLPVPYLVTYREIQLSGVLTERVAREEAR